MAGKSAKLIEHAKHEWPINWLRNYRPGKDETLCLSILGLVYKSGNWVSWFSTLTILYIHLQCTADRDRASILSLVNMSTKEKSSWQTVNMENLRARWRNVKNYLRAKWRVAKKLCMQRVNYVYPLYPVYFIVNCIYLIYLTTDYIYRIYITINYVYTECILLLTSSIGHTLLLIVLIMSTGYAYTLLLTTGIYVINKRRIVFLNSN